MSDNFGLRLTKEEVKMLLKLIEAKNCITTKCTNKTSNLLKEEAWSSITEDFNASIMSAPRRTAQLRLKWENLKKAARKRTARIRQNSFEEEGKGEYVPPDEILDRVAEILSTAYTGMESSLEEDFVQVITTAEMETTNEISNQQSIILNPLQNSDEDIIPTPKSPNRPNKFNYGHIDKKKLKLSQELVKSKIEKNKAIAEFVKKKSEKLDKEIDIQKLIEEKLKLQIQRLKSNDMDTFTFAWD